MAVTNFPARVVFIGDPKLSMFSSYLIFLGMKGLIFLLQVWGWNLGKCMLSETLRSTIMVSCNKSPVIPICKAPFTKWLWGLAC